MKNISTMAVIFRYSYWGRKKKTLHFKQHKTMLLYKWSYYVITYVHNHLSWIMSANDIVLLCFNAVKSVDQLENKWSRFPLFVIVKTVFFLCGIIYTVFEYYLLPSERFGLDTYRSNDGPRTLRGWMVAPRDT